MSVDITMTAGGLAYVLGNSVSGQGLYAIPVHASTVNEAIAAAHATLPRIDSVYLVVQDNTHDASGQNRAQVTIVTGTATSGATLTNRTGAGAAPASSLLLADVLVAATDTAIANNEIRDRRPWARGAAYAYDRGSSSNYTTNLTGLTSIDATNLKPRLELSGVPVEIELNIGLIEGSAASLVTFVPTLNGVASQSRERLFSITAASTYYAPTLRWVIPAPAAGSYVIDMQWSSSTGATLTARANTANSVTFAVRERIIQNAANNAVTSG